MEDAGQARQGARQREHRRYDGPRIDAREPHRFAVGADGDEVAAEHGARQQHLPGRDDQHREQEGRREAQAGSGAPSAAIAPPT